MAMETPEEKARRTQRTTWIVVGIFLLMNAVILWKVLMDKPAQPASPPPIPPPATR
jgi:hypothetical protein